MKCKRNRHIDKKDNDSSNSDSNAASKDQCFHAYSRENKTKISVQKGAKNKSVVHLKIATKNRCLQNIGVGSL
jgi:hypothetical protein